jgi:hypothetical protein
MAMAADLQLDVRTYPDIEVRLTAVKDKNGDKDSKKIYRYKLR